MKQESKIQTPSHCLRLGQVGFACGQFVRLVSLLRSPIWNDTLIKRTLEGTLISTATHVLASVHQETCVVKDEVPDLTMRYFGLPGLPVVPCCPFPFGVSPVEPESREKGTLNLKGLLGSLV